MKAEQESLTALLDSLTDLADSEDDAGHGPDQSRELCFSYLAELQIDWQHICSERAAARSRGEYLPLTPFQLRIGRECARMEAALLKRAGRRGSGDPRSAVVQSSSSALPVAPASSQHPGTAGVPPASAAPPTPSGPSRKQLRNAEKHRKRQERKKLERARREALNAARRLAAKEARNANQSNQPIPPAELRALPASARQATKPAYRAQAS